jgi:hypothetical protein
MADGEWIAGIKKARTLTYFNGANVGRWAGIVDLAAQAFNQMPDSIVTYQATKDKDAANVVVGVAGKEAKFDPGNHNLPPLKMTSLIHGKTRTIDLGNGIQKAGCFLPVNTAADEKNYLIFIAAHELLHATGLEDHVNDGLLMNHPNMFDGNIFASADSTKMPPLFLGPKAAARMAAKW